MILDQLAVGQCDAMCKKACRHVTRIDDGSGCIAEQTVQTAGGYDNAFSRNKESFFSMTAIGVGSINGAVFNGQVEKIEIRQSFDQTGFFVFAKFVNQSCYDLFTCRCIGVDRAVYTLPSERAQRRFAGFVQRKSGCQ